jgi:hypothetical protein
MDGATNVNTMYIVALNCSKGRICLIKTTYTLENQTFSILWFVFAQQICFIEIVLISSVSAFMPVHKNTAFFTL